MKKSDTAQVRRDALATAFREWLETDDEADIAFEAVLIATQTITDEDIVDEITLSDDGEEARIVLNGDELLTIDKWGNTARGAME